MTTRDIKNKIDVSDSLAPASRTVAGNGTGVDLRGYGTAMVVFHAGAAGGTTPSFLFGVEDSDDNSTFAAVDAAFLQGTPPTITATPTAGYLLDRVGYIGSKRYIRAIVKTVTGTSPTLLCAAQVVRGSPAQAPTA